MPEIYRALVVLMVIGLAVHGLAARLQSEQLPHAHALRRGLWFALTIVAFVLGNFWLFAAVATALLLWARDRDENGPALFLALLFVVPPPAHDIPGLGLVNYVFGLNQPRLLALLLLAPLALRLARQPREPARGPMRLADLSLLGYLLVQVLLLSREETLSSALRSMFYLGLDIALPYYVFSRGFDSLAKLRDAAAALVVAGLLLSAIGIFEASKHWLLYAPLTQAWGSAEQLLYLGRSGVLRALATTGHSIALGYVLAICLLLYLPMHARLQGWQRHAMLLLLAAGLFSPLSRGPWLGAVAGLVLYLLLGPRPGRNLFACAGAGLVAVVLLWILPFGHFVIDLIPFVGTVETGNIDYRQRLVENAMQLIWRHPLLGSGDYEERLAAMGMVQGQGIVDIVNSYVQVALSSGLAGLMLFAGILAGAFLSALRARQLALRTRQRDAAELGRALLAAQLCVIVTIGSVSSILVIPWVYWCLAGLLVSYARTMQAAARDARVAAGELRFA